MLKEATPGKLSEMVTCSITSEIEVWRKLELSYRIESENDITYSQREDVLRWLLVMNERLQFYPEAYALASALLDKFLTQVKARPRYLKCIGLTCFYLAAKLTEEDELVPTTSELVRLSGAGCTVDDVVRMERIVLNKLGWNINLPTSLNFLQMFHAYILTICPTLLDTVTEMTPGRQLTILTRKLQRATFSKEMCHHQPSVIALSLLSLELQQFRRDWFPLMLTVLKLTKVSYTDLISCQETLGLMLSIQPIDSTNHHHNHDHHHCIKRKAHDLDEQDDIYDSIKKLYNEDNWTETSTVPAQLLETEA